MEELKQDFIEFLKNFELITIHHPAEYDKDLDAELEAYDSFRMNFGKYTYLTEKNVWDNIFNKEYFHPEDNILPEYPEGLLIIRIDEDFAVVARFPYKYAALPIEFIVEQVWPNLYPKAKYYHDTVATLAGTYIDEDEEDEEEYSE